MLTASRDEPSDNACMALRNEYDCIMLTQFVTHYFESEVKINVH